MDLHRDPYKTEYIINAVNVIIVDDVTFGNATVTALKNIHIALMQWFPT